MEKKMDKKKRIVFVLAQLVGGGAEKVTMNIMSSLDKTLFDIHLIVMDKKGPSFDLIPDNVTLHDLKIPKTILSVFKLRRKIFEINPDIVFSSLIRTHITLFLALLATKSRPIVIMRSPNSPKLLLQNRELPLIKKLLLDSAYKKSDYILAQTPEMKDELIFFHKIEKSKVLVFLNPVNIRDIEKKLNNISSPFTNEHDINVVASGRITEQKGFDTLIKAFSKVLKTNSNFHLYIIGEDVTGEKEKLLKMAQELKIEKHIHFLGFQKNPYRYYYFSDLFVLSSRWEGLPNTVLENLYLNKPIIATHCIPYMSKLITDGKNGLLVDVDNIEELADAILHYKTIDPKYSNKSFSDKSNVNELFLSFLENK